MRRQAILQTIAIILIFGVALCADGLADLPHGFGIMFAIIGVAGVLVAVSNRPGEQENRPRYHHYQGRRHQRKR
ncbi:MAG: hypothetical protein RR403_03205 [Pseudoflavonifractor sp.]